MERAVNCAAVKGAAESGSAFTHVVAAASNLGKNALEGFVRALKLDDDEAAFFRDLVVLAQAETVAERNRAFERVSANRRFRRAR